MVANLGLDGPVRLKPEHDRVSSTRRLMRLVDQQQNARHVIMLHDRGAHRDAVPHFLQSGEVLGLLNGLAMWHLCRADASTRSECVWKAIVPRIQLGLKSEPPLQERLLRHPKRPTVHRPVVTHAQIIPGTNEVDDLRQNPDQAVADEILLHPVAFRIPCGPHIVGTHEAQVVELQARFGPQHQVISIEPCMAFIDD